MAEKDKKPRKVEIQNRKAGFNFHIDYRYDAGIMLTGTEVKSIRAGHANISDAYCYMEGGELFIKGMHVSEFSHAGYTSHDPLRDRKLLLNKLELKKIHQRIREKGMAVFPIRLFENERGLLKLEIGLGKGKKQFDKRDDIKERDVQRDLERYN
jgi:SsrA-binding protein